MKIVIDARRKLNSGIGRVTQWLVNNLKPTHFGCVYDVYYLTTPGRAIEYRIPFERQILCDYPPFSFDEVYLCPHLLVQNEADLFIQTQVNGSPFMLIPTISIIHDLWFLTKPNFVPSVSEVEKRFGIQSNSFMQIRGNYLNEDRLSCILTDFGLKLYNETKLNPACRYLWSQVVGTIECSREIVFVSSLVKDDFSKIFKRKNGTQIICNGLSDIWRSTERKGKKHFLCLAKLEPRKNVLLLLEAYERFCGAGAHDIGLIIAGDPGYADYAQLVHQKISAMRERGINAEFIESAYDSHLLSLMSDAVALFSVSEYESFGLPSLEAMAAGVPVFAYPTGQLLGALGKYANIINDLTDCSITRAMTEVALSPESFEARAAVARLSVYRQINNTEIINRWQDVIGRYS